MAAVLEGDGPARMRRWSIVAWLRARARGVLVEAPQPNGDLLRISCEDCGPSVEYSRADGKGWKLRCDDSLTGDLLNGEWVRVSVEFDRGVAIRVHEKEIRREADLEQVVLEDWALGGADVDVGLLQVLDHEKWPSVELGALRSSLPLVLASAVAALAGVVAISCSWILKAPDGMRFEEQSWLTWATELYVNVINTALAACGVAVVVAVLLMLAFGPTGGQVGLTDLLFGMVAGHLTMVSLPLCTGVALFVAGVLGIRMARTRECDWVLLYLPIVCFCLWQQFAIMHYLDALPSIDALDPKFQPELAEITDSQVLSDMRSQIWSKGQQPMLRQLQDAFVQLMGRSNYDCALLDDAQAACDAGVSESGMIQCSQPYAIARGFQRLVNSQCSSGLDNSVCSGCVENFGKLAGTTDWDPRKPANRVFCKCATNFFSYARGGAQQLGNLCRCLQYMEILLMASILYLGCCVRSRREVLLHQAGDRVQRAKEAAPRKLKEQGRRLGLVPESPPGSSRGLAAPGPRAQRQQAPAAPGAPRSELAPLALTSCAALQLLLGLAVLAAALALLPAALRRAGLAAGALALALGLCGCCFYAASPCSLCYSAAMMMLTGVLAALAGIEWRGSDQALFPAAANASEAADLTAPSAAALSLLAAFGRGPFLAALGGEGGPGCEVSAAGRRCSVASENLLCRHQGAERLEWLVNRACGPSQACDACVRQRGADEAPGRLWCKCLGALEQSRQRLRVPLVLAVAAVAHAAVALTATAEHAAAAAAGGAERGGEARLLSEPLVREIELGGGSPVRSAGASEASYSEMPPAPGRA